MTRLRERKGASTTATRPEECRGQRNMFRLLCVRWSACSQLGCELVRPTCEFGALESPDGNLMWGSSRVLRDVNSHENGGSIFLH